MLIHTIVFGLLSTFLPHAASLNCHICAEAGLEEFGECSSLYKYNCDNYQKRFPKTDKVYCRTTRHKVKSGTYTVVKECIAESAHYSTFPRKVYDLEKECDVVKVEGLEVAYCVCRDGDYCNKEAIVEQFTKFESEHPDFFDESSEATAPTTTNESNVNFGEIINNKTEFDSILKESGAPISSNSPFDISRPDPSMLPTSKTPLTKDQLSTQMLFSTISVIPRDNSLATTTTNKPIEPEIPSGSILGTLPKLQCMHCAQAGLSDLNADCSSQDAIECSDRSRLEPGVGRPLCFSRQMVSKEENIGVEKMCVMEKDVIQEYGKHAMEMLRAIDENGVKCAVVPINGLNSTFCICANSLCNRPPIIDQQQAALNDIATTPPLPVEVTTQSFTTQGNTLATEAEVPNRRQLTPFATKTTGTPNKETTTTTTGRQSTTAASSSLEPPHNCAVCVDVALKDPLEDCHKASTQNCAQQILGEKAFCLTRQTQNGKDAFIVEKSCVSGAQFFSLFPEERRKSSNGEVPLGCASTYDGYVNYCICDGPMCNRNSLTNQAESLAKSDAVSVPTQPSSSQKPQLPMMGNDDNIMNIHSSFGTVGTTKSPTTGKPSTTASRQNLMPEVRVEETAGFTRKRPLHAFSENTNKDSKNASPATTTPTTTPSSIVKLGGNDASLRDRLEKWKTATSETASHGSSSSSVTPTLVLVSALVIHSVTVLVVGSWR